MMKGGRERISWRSRGIGKPRPFDVSERLAIGPTLQHFAMLATWALFRDEEQKFKSFHMRITSVACIHVTDEDGMQPFVSW